MEKDEIPCTYARVKCFDLLCRPFTFFCVTCTKKKERNSEDCEEIEAGKMESLMARHEKGLKDLVTFCESRRPIVLLIDPLQ